MSLFHSSLFFQFWLVLIFDLVINHSWGEGTCVLNMFNYTCRDMCTSLHLWHVLPSEEKSPFPRFCFIFGVKQPNNKPLGENHIGTANTDKQKLHPWASFGKYTLMLSAYCWQEKQWGVPRGQIFTSVCASECKRVLRCTRQRALSITTPCVVPATVYANYTCWHARTAKHPRVGV